MKRKIRQSPIRVLEDAVHVLRRSAWTALPAYYIGSMPFILGLLYFIGDMSRNAFAWQYNAIASFGLALLFIWMKCWQARFTTLLLSRISGQPVPHRSYPQLLGLAAHQAFIHCTGFIVLPISLLLLLPYGWCYAFYQNATALAYTSEDDLIDSCRRAWRQALLWPRQNHLIISIMSLFGAVVYINIAIATFIIPHGIKRFAGVETIFTLTGGAVLNTTFLAVTMGLAYLCLDPIIKSAYMLRCYYGDALKTGADLHAQLARIKNMQTMAIAALLLIVIMMPVNLTASQTSSGNAIDDSVRAAPLTSSRLDRSIDQVLQQREFAWRLPQQKRGTDSLEKRGPLATALEWIANKIIKAAEWLWHQMERFAKWIDRLLPKKSARESDPSTGPRVSARFLLIMLLIVVACVAVYFVLKNWQRSRQEPVDEPADLISVEPDLTDESIKADSLPVQSWLEMAGKLQRQGSFRLAMRALYLATLSHLADREYITIQVYKSNREYQLELARKASDQASVLKAFAKMVIIFERIWYGRHPASEHDYNNYFGIHRNIMGGADAT